MVIRSALSPLLGWALLHTTPTGGWAQTPGQSIQATVVSIGDGDTIRVRQAGQAITVRMACIDAPETAQAPYGQQARHYLQQRLPIGKRVTLEVKHTDRYGRTIAEVISGININLAMLEDGQAFAYRQYLGRCNAGEYRNAEERARRRRSGVWQVTGGITRPWEFRRQHKGGTALTAVPSQPSAGQGIGVRHRHLQHGHRAWSGQLSLPC